MKIYLEQNVYDAAMDRIRWLFSEFKNVIVNCSGGKDSTIVVHLALQVAEELGRLPVKVLFIDQEAEWQCTIDAVRQIMDDPRVEPRWLQVPIRLFNATSTYAPWLWCWRVGDPWIRDKEPDSIKENTYGADRFAKMFAAFGVAEFNNDSYCIIAGVRAEESPGRLVGLTAYETYKGVTWGRVYNKKRCQYGFYPIYDWSYTDVWKAIHDNGWPYCRLYDYLYQYGTAPRNMRVSNVHHETAIKSLFFMQEIEPDTWDKITARLSGISSAGQLRKDWLQIGELPFMFNTWAEYRNHLLENLITDETIKETLRRQFTSYDKAYDESAQHDLMRTQISMILNNDYHGTKLSTFRAAHGQQSKNRGKRDRYRSTAPAN